MSEVTISLFLLIFLLNNKICKFEKCNFLAPFRFLELTKPNKIIKDRINILSCLLWWAVLDCLDTLAINVSAGFLLRNFVSPKKSPSHSARVSLEPQTRLRLVVLVPNTQNKKDAN